MTKVEFRLKAHGVTLSFGEWMPSDVPSPHYQLNSVWVHVSGVPPAYRHYLAIWAIGTVLGSPQEIDMKCLRQRGIIRMKVEMMDANLLPVKTDIVFGLDGYEITFTLEDQSFLVEVGADPPLGGDFNDDDDDLLDESDDHTSGSKEQSKKSKKNDSMVSDNISGNSAPMQVDKNMKASSRLMEQGAGLLPSLDSPKPSHIAVTPFNPKHKSFSLKPSGSSGSSAGKLPKTMVQQNSQGVQPVVELQAALVLQGDQQILQTPPRLAVPSVERVPALKCSSADWNSCTAEGFSHGHNDPASFIPRTKERAHVEDLALQNLLTQTSIRPESSKMLQGEMVQNGPQFLADMDSVQKSSPNLRRSSRTNAVCSSVGIAAADEDITARAMRRVAVRNLDYPLKESSASVRNGTNPGCLPMYTLAPYLGNFAEARFSGHGYGGLSVFGEGGQGLFYPGVWVAA
ncbi:uncharacterized protein LOC133911776 [Phragmites australis]|uniref:uncharacterized protein LOC133911776 n=1 Tax=Phragmites australis TaxID=29695 RepID=UPI002D767433|nr:uncharacterized protein LOC133911776 [Phragmites australis]